jgi:rfaE bifunctional protein kinase chain/domain/rfaE bifunctional protein nucleotidyltransferase chain/domain
MDAPGSHKVCSLARLLAVREQARQAGRAVVHCHGCFDIVHPGHIRHLQFARSLGDVLIVSVSADRQVSKGVNRPLIPDDLRAANLAALECVDWVYVNPHPTAVELLGELRPDIYVKGKEYEYNQDPRFLAERDAVVRHGGRVVFSSGDLIYSSTALINSIGPGQNFNAEKVRRFRHLHGLGGGALHDAAARFAGRRIVVVGDYIVDRYHFCQATGVASEAPMMTLRQTAQRDFDGGAGVVALHLAGLGASPALVTSLADDEPSAQIAQALCEAGVEVIVPRRGRHVPMHHRFLAGDTKVQRVEEGSPQPLDSQQTQLAGDAILAAADGADAAIFAEFGYGLIGPGLLDRVLPELRGRGIVVSADVSGWQANLLHFKGVDLLCPTEREMRQTLHDFSAGLNAVVSRLLEVTAARSAIITMGKEGLVVFDRNPQIADRASWDRQLRSEYLPALSGGAVDPLGAGDALLATATLAMASGSSLQAAALLGALAASIEVQRLGNEPIGIEELMGAISQCPDHRAAMVA